MIFNRRACPSGKTIVKTSVMLVKTNVKKDSLSFRLFKGVFAFCEKK